MPKLLTTKSPKRPMSGKMEIVFSAHASVANVTVSVSICSRDTNARLGFREYYLVYYWRHQTITWINLDWASISKFSGIHMGSRKHSWYQSIKWVCKVHSKISTASPHIVNELMSNALRCDVAMLTDCWDDWLYTNEKHTRCPLEKCESN